MGFADPIETLAWAEETMKRLREPISDRLGVGVRAPLSRTSCGSYGCVFDTDKKALLVKLTTDPEEAGAAHHIADLQRGGWLRDAIRIKSVHQVAGSPKAWVIVRERVRPGNLDPMDESVLWEANGELWGAYQKGIKADPTAMRLWKVMLGRPALLPLVRLRTELLQLGMTALDLRGPNVGRRAFAMKGWSRPGSLVLLDTGGVTALDGTPLPTSPIPTLSPRRQGAANRSCPGQAKLERHFAALTGRDEAGGHCELVSKKKLHGVARKHGWNAPKGIVGFHTPDDKIYVSRDERWSVAHELGHRYGLTDDQMGRWLSEALTEFVAEESARRAGEPHQPTYGYERSLVEGVVSLAANRTPLQLARLAANSDRPHEEIADLMLADPKWRSVGRRQVVKALRKGSGDEPDLFANLARRAAA